WMLVDDDVALILGREALGYPKKLGEISLSIESSQARATVDRRGARLLEIEGRLLGAHKAPPPMLGRRFCNVQGTIRLSLPRPLSFTPREEILEAREAALRVKLAGSDRDPLPALGIGEATGGCLYRVNIGAASLPFPVRPVSPLFTVRSHALR